MIIKYGPDKNDPYKDWADVKNVFVSRPFFKLVFNNGLGVYILNAYNYRLFPKFYGTVQNSFWEFGISFAGYMFEIMWNKSFKIK